MDAGRHSSNSDVGKSAERHTESVSRWQQHLLPASAADPSGEEDDKEESYLEIRGVARRISSGGVGRKTTISIHSYPTEDQVLLCGQTEILSLDIYGIPG